MTLFFRLARTVHGGWAGTEPEPSNLVVSDRLPAFWRLGQSPRLTQTRNCRYQPRRVHCWRATVRQGVRGPARPGPARRAARVALTPARRRLGGALGAVGACGGLSGRTPVSPLSCMYPRMLVALANTEH